jgi:hypothetical protein
MTYYSRHLPHWQPLGKAIFLTWRLFGSLPQGVIAELQRHRNLSEGKTFLMADRELDSARTGPRWLNQASIARCVIDALYRENMSCTSTCSARSPSCPITFTFSSSHPFRSRGSQMVSKALLLARPISYSGKRADISGKTNRSTIEYEMAPNTIESEGISNRIPSPLASSRIPRTGRGRALPVGQPLLAVHERVALEADAPIHPSKSPLSHVRNVVAARQHASDPDGQPRVAVLLKLRDLRKVEITHLHGRDDHFERFFPGGAHGGAQQLDVR